MEAYLDDLLARLRAPDQADAVAARDAVRALSVPRMAGSEGADRVERWIRRRFERLGYETRLLPFAFSTVPGRFGVPALASLLALGALAAGGALMGGRPFAALAALAAPVLVALAAGRLAPGWIQSLPWGRLESRNLLFSRPDARVRYVIAAHRDSKSQPVSTAARLGAGLAAAAGVAGLLGLAAHALAGLGAARLGAWAEERIPATLLGSAREIFGPLLALDPPAVLIAAVTTLAVVGAAVLALSWAGNDSPGALDNATGVAAALALAERLAARADVAFLITDAEELGLVGARAAAPGLASLMGVINLDGIDDVGPVHIVERYGFPRRGRAPHMAAALLAAANALDLEAERHDAPLGILLEHSAYSDAGVPSLTLLRGHRGALRRIHRPADRPDLIGGRGVASAVALIEGALHLLDAPERAFAARPLLPGREHPSASELRPPPGASRTPLFAHRPVEDPLPLGDDADDPR